MRVRGAVALVAALLALQVALPVVAQNQTDCPEGACDGLQPDLVASSFHAVLPAQPDGPVLLQAEVRNDGAAEATFGVSFLVDGALHVSLGGKHLAPGGSLLLEQEWHAPPGVHDVEFRVDAGDDVAESDEGNNVLRRSLDVAGEPEPAGTWTECRDGREWKVEQHADGTRTEWDVGPCEPHPDPHHPDPYQDPYGCDGAAGQWWDHYLARCVSEAEWQLQDAFFRCTEAAHAGLAQEQKARDIEEREKRQERRALETKAMDLERQGRFDEARAVWDELGRLDWEDQRRFHGLEQQRADRINACVDEFSQKARANGWDYLVEEFEMQRFHAMAPMPMPAHPGFECPPGGFGGGPGAYPAQPYEVRDSHPEPGRASYPGPGEYPEPHGEPYGAPAGGPGPGDPCGPGGHGPEPEFGYGLPPEAVAAMEEARVWCEQQRWEVEERMYAAASYEDAQAAEGDLRDVEQQCRERMEAIFREHDRGYEDDFDRRFGGFSMTETSTGIDVRGANAWFIGLPEQMRLTDFTCQGVSTLSLVQPYFDIEDVHPIAEHKLGFFAGSDRPFLVVHDDPHCTVGIKPQNARADGAELKVTLSSLYACERGERIVCTDPDGKTVTVVAHGEEPALVDERTLLVRDAVDIRLGAADFDGLDPYLDNEHFDGSAAVTVHEGRVVAQTVALGDMEMTVSEGDGETLKVSLQKATHVGSFVVLALDEALFADCAVQVEGWDVTDGDRAPLELRQAASLADALDASYEGDHVKYYAVQDAHGCQLILTNGHYSEKEFTLMAADGPGLGESVPGLGVVLVPGLLVAVAVRLRRRE